MVKIYSFSAKKLFLCSSTSSCKPLRWMRFDTMKDTHINSSLELTKFISSCGSTEFKDTLPWKVSKMITKTFPIHTRIVTSCTMGRGVPFWVWRKSMETDTTQLLFFQKRESYCRKNTSLRRNKSKRAGLWESRSGIRVGKLNIWMTLLR